MSVSPTVRQPIPGIGQAVFTSRIARESDRGDWANVGVRVARGNVSILGDVNEDLALYREFTELRDHIQKATILMSGRHLQHGDDTQPGRNMEVFSNCSTAATSFAKLYLLLNGSGVGRDYSDDLMVVDWRFAPDVKCVLGFAHEDSAFLRRGQVHPDSCVDPDGNPVDRMVAGVGVSFPTFEEAAGDLIAAGKDYSVFVVPDSREGWAQAVELIEYMTYVRHYEGHTLILDFSQVRPEGAPIGGMQDRPASGPLPLMKAIDAINVARTSGWAPWKQSLYIDHELAACVAVGGVRRAARIAVKWWKDADIMDFINVKQTGGFWSANNSVAVDQEFWNLVVHAEGYLKMSGHGVKALPAHVRRAYEVFNAIMEAQYLHATGEPGFLNVDRINQNMDGFEKTYNSYDPDFMGSAKYTVDPRTRRHLLSAVMGVVRERTYPFIVNPCGEIPLLVLGAYCVIADTVPFHCDTLEEVIQAMKAAGRALVRVNRMDSLYDAEVARTNRVGIGMTGVFEFAWKFFGLGFRDLLQERGAGKPFWAFLERARNEVTADLQEYCRAQGWAVPHTMFTMKPAGTTSKLFGLSEGAHLPARAEYLRFLQLNGGDAPKADEYELRGYPVRRNVVNEAGNQVAEAIVGFPTRPTLFSLDIPEDKVVMADEATMEEQFRWVSLLEKYWLGQEHGAQVSYTLKFDKDRVSYEEYRRTILEQGPRVRCISLMPASDWKESKARYGYVPEEPISREEYDRLVAQIEGIAELISDEHLDCAKGGCPI